MKSTQTLLLAATLSAGLLTATGANATLVGSADGKTVWDADVSGGITWLSNANLAATNSFGLARNVDLGTIPGVNTYGGSYIYNDGRMTWGGAMKWIDAMNASNGGAGYLGYNNWRLPTTTDTGIPGYQMSYNSTDGGYNNPTTSEMSHLYYTELGNKGYFSTTGAYQPGYGLVNDPANPNDESLFTNLQSDIYWSRTEYAVGTLNAWDFNFRYGYQNYHGKILSSFALAVRPGQVAAVPVPAAAWLLGSGFLGLIGVARRKIA